MTGSLASVSSSLFIVLWSAGVVTMFGGLQTGGSDVLHSEAIFEARVRELGLGHLWKARDAGPGMGFQHNRLTTYAALAWATPYKPLGQSGDQTMAEVPMLKLIHEKLKAWRSVDPAVQ